MTYTTQGKSTVALTAYHVDEGANIVLSISGGQNVTLDQEQREALAAYLLKENN